MKQIFKTMEVDGVVHVLKLVERKARMFNPEQGKVTTPPQADFMGTGMALCGILRKKQSLENFIEEYNKQQKRKSKKRKTVAA